MTHSLYTGNHQPVNWARFQSQSLGDAALIHYCYHSGDPALGWSWNKRDYRPWSRIPDPPPDVPTASRHLVEAINEFAEKKRSLIR